MSPTALKTGGQKPPQSESKSVAGRASTANKQNATSSTLDNFGLAVTAGALGLGITLLEQERAEASAKDEGANSASHAGTASVPIAETAATVHSPTQLELMASAEIMPAAVTMAGNHEFAIEMPVTVDNEIASDVPVPHETADVVANTGAADGDVDSSNMGIGQLQDTATEKQLAASGSPAEIEISAISPSQQVAIPASFGGSVAEIEISAISPSLQIAIPASVGSGLTTQPAVPTAGIVDLAPELTTIIPSALDAVGGLVDDLLSGGENGDGLVGGLTTTISGTLDAVGGVVDDLLSGGADGDGLVTELTTTVGDTLDAVGGLVDDLLSGGEDGDGLVGDLTTTVGDTLDAVGSVVDDLLSGGEDGDGLVGDLTTTVGDTLDAVGSVVDDLLSGGEDGDGLVGDLTTTVGDTLDAVGSVVDDLLSGGEDGDGLVGGLTTTISGTLGAIGSVVDDSQKADLDSASNETPSSGSVDTQSDMFDAIGQGLELTEGLLGLLVPKVGFVGQSTVESEAHDIADNPHGSLLHLLT